MTWQNITKWHPRAAVTIRDGRGPEVTRLEEPPADWKPPAPAGFAPPSVEADPLRWEGDDA